MEDSKTLVFILTQIVYLIGLFGLLIPLFPAVPVLWLSVLGYGLLMGWSTLGIVMFVIITVLAIFATVVDNLLMGAGARKGGASWLTIGVALLAGIAGTLLVPPIGGLIAAPLAVLLLEYRRQGDWNKAWVSIKGLATGWGLAFFVRFGIGLVMMFLWWIWVWRG